MATIKMSSDEARSKWREVIDTAVAGNHIVIERYGKPVVAIVAHPQFLQSFGQTNVVREATAVYQTNSWDRETLKAELITEIKAELLAEPMFREAMLQYELTQMQQSEMTHLEEEFADYEQRYPKTDLRN
jgi:antitoxin (DNA-binding transcriptional repressor) of toxin-antitoxin stability system